MSAIRTAPMWLALGVTIAAAPVAAHDLWPAYLEIREETGVDQYSAYWKVPARDGRPLALELMWPSNCVFETPIDRLVARAWVSQWQLSCPGGLQGRSLGVHGLDRAATDVLVRIVAATGRFSTHRLTPDNAEFSVPEMRDPPSNLASWVALGIEHIIAGPDHLAFVLALLLLVRNFRRLITTVTAFTLAHSLTLSAAALGWVWVPVDAVEAVIALSVLFVAVEVARKPVAGMAATPRRPWALAFVFGLVHGFGFAGAMRDIGLPVEAVPPALLGFNIGVELGQLAFVGVILLLFAGYNRLVADTFAPWPAAARCARPLSYVIGSVAAYWWLERAVRMWS